MSGRLSKIFLSTVVLFPAAVVPSRSQDSGLPDPTRASYTAYYYWNAQNFDDRVHYAALGQIYLGHIALERSSNDQVRALAKKVVSDNSVMAQRIQTIKAADAVLKGSTVDIQRSKPGQLAAGGPDSIDLSQVSDRYRKMGEQLLSLTGSDLDREYLEMVKADHRMLKYDLENAPAGGEYRFEAAFAREMLPSVRQNLAEADRIRDGL
jgi:predicted outer membrane protein